MNTFNDFIFHDALEAQLRLLFDNPVKIPGPLCFYGHPGNGKTSFARLLAEKAANATEYFDMNARKANGESFGNILADIRRCGSVRSLYGTGGIWKRAIIIDEWHDLTENQQNACKVPFQEYSEDNRTLFILCANTDRDNSIDDILTPAIRSRCYSISFNTPQIKADEVKQKIAERYPEMSASIIDDKFPDMRQISKHASLL